MIKIKKGFKSKYTYGGSGLFENLITSLSKKLPEIAEKQATEVGKKLASKAVDKIAAKIQSKDNSSLSPESKMIIDKYTKGAAIPIQDLVKKKT